MKVKVRNFGGAAAEGISGHLYTTTPGVTITDNEVEFGSIPPADSAWSLTGFGVRLDAGLPDNYPVACSLVCEDGTDETWVSEFELRASNAVMFYVGCVIDDAGSTWPNGRLDPGETAELVISLGNSGMGNRYDVRGALRSIDTIIVVTDTHGFFGTILSGDTVESTDRFAITARPGLTPGIEVPHALRIIGDHGFDTSIVFNLLTGEMVASDPIPDGPRTPPVYFAYDDADVFYQQAPTYDWVELRGTGTLLELADQETKPLALPPEFGPFYFYGERFDTLSVCSNGWFAPGVTTDRSWQNRELPTNRNRALVAVLWDDLNPQLGGGVHYRHDAANHRFIIEWDSVHYSGQPSDWDRFEVIIYDTTLAGPDGNSTMTMQYATAHNLVSSTIGMQNATGLVGINCIFDNTLHRGSAPFTAGRAVRFTTEPPELIGIEEPAGTAETPAGRRLTVTPNPTSGRTLVHFSLKQPGAAAVRVYDAGGRAVRTLVDVRLPAGAHVVAWDGRSDKGQTLTHGVYFARLTGDGRQTEAKVVIAR